MDSQHVRPGRRWWALVLLVALCCRPASAASAADCTPQLQVDAEYYVFPVGPQPACVVTGDWNEDGHVDVATANYGDGSVTVLLGTGGFHLRAGVRVKLMHAPYWMVARDMNRDGHLDLVVSDLTETAVLVGDGAGGFEVAARYPVPGLYIAIGDLDGDGFQDLVVAGPSLSILHLHGLDLSRVETLPAGVSTIVLGDVNEDGHLDMMTREGNSVAVRLNQGDGRFALPIVYRGTCRSPEGLLREGTETYEEPEPGASGRAGPPTVFGTDGQGDTAMGDLNGDGHLDIAAVGGTCVGVMYGVGDGTFTPASGGLQSIQLERRQERKHHPIPTTEGQLSAYTYDPRAPWFILLADLAGDQHDRAVWLASYPGRNMMGQRSVDAVAATVADINEDGRLDVVVAGWNGVVAVHPVEADGWPRLNPDVYISSPWGAALKDVNLDGAEDVVIWGDGRLNLILRNSDGSFRSELETPSRGDHGPVFVDVNADGKLDLLEFGAYLFLGHGDGTFESEGVRFFDRYLYSLEAGDFDEDGNIDLVAISPTFPGPIVMLKGRGDGTFSVAWRMGADAVRVQAIDLDEDGHLDLVTNRLGGADVAFGKGDAGFTSATPLSSDPGVSASICSFGDVDGDGHLDLVGLERKSADNSTGVVYLSSGRSFRRIEAGFSGAPEVADVDGDGRLDVIAAGGDFEGVGLYSGNGDGTFRQPLEAYGPTGNQRDNYVLVDQTRPGQQDIIVLSQYDPDGYDSHATRIVNRITPNRAPVTTAVRAVVTRPRGPDHGWADVSIAGVSDPDGDAVSIAVTGVTQDEPVASRVGLEALVVGANTQRLAMPTEIVQRLQAPRPWGRGGRPDLGWPRCSDARIVGGQAQVHWERTGSGNGRVYVVHFTATDGCGGMSAGLVAVCVPHDAASTTCVDDGQLYNSLGCGTGSAGTEVALESGEGLLPPEIRGGGAELRYMLAKPAEVRLEIFDLLGRRRAVVAGGLQPEGEHRARWDALGAAGVYFARLSIGQQSYVKRFALLP